MKLRILSLIICFCYTASTFAAIEEKCQETAGKYLIRGNMTSEFGGDRLWSLARIARDYNQDKTAECLEQIRTGALTDARDYWGGYVAGRYNCNGQEANSLAAEKPEQCPAEKYDKIKENMDYIAAIESGQVVAPPGGNDRKRSALALTKKVKENCDNAKKDPVVPLQKVAEVAVAQNPPDECAKYGKKKPVNGNNPDAAAEGFFKSCSKGTWDAVKNGAKAVRNAYNYVMEGKVIEDTYNFFKNSFIKVSQFVQDDAYRASVMSAISDLQAVLNQSPQQAMKAIYNAITMTLVERNAKFQCMTDDEISKEACEILAKEGMFALLGLGAIRGIVLAVKAGKTVGAGLTVVKGATRAAETTAIAGKGAAEATALGSSAGGAATSSAATTAAEAAGSAAGGNSVPLLAGPSTTGNAVANAAKTAGSVTTSTGTATGAGASTAESTVGAGAGTSTGGSSVPLLGSSTAKETAAGAAKEATKEAASAADNGVKALADSSKAEKQKAAAKAKEEADNQRTREAADRHKTKVEAERKAKAEAEEKARAEAERKAKEQAEKQAREEAERKVREETAQKAAAEEKKKQADEAAAKAKARAEEERKARQKAKEQAYEKAKAEEKLREERARREAEENKKNQGKFDLNKDRKEIQNIKNSQIRDIYDVEDALEMPNAKRSELKKAIRVLTQKYHPDLNPNNKAVADEITAKLNRMRSIVDDKNQP